MTYKISKADLIDGIKVAKRVIGRSAKTADAEVELAKSGSEMTLRAQFPGLCYFEWSIAGSDKVPFDRVIAPLDALHRLAERMPADTISVGIDPKNKSKMKILCGNRNGKIDVRLEKMAFKDIDDDAEPVGSDEMTDLGRAIRMFNKVSLKGFNAWGCVCATTDGTGYASDEGNMVVAPFPIVSEGDHNLMLPAHVLAPVASLRGGVKSYVSDNLFALKNDRWKFVVVTTYVKAPSYDKVIKRFTSKPLVDMDIDSITKEVRDFRKACKEGSLILTIKDGLLKVKAARDAGITYNSQRDVEQAPDMTMALIPENYLKVAPNFKKVVKVAKADGSHLFMDDGSKKGIVSCHAGTIKFS